METRTRVLRHEHPGTLTAMDSLAFTLRILKPQPERLVANENILSDTDTDSQPLSSGYRVFT